MEESSSLSSCFICGGASFIRSGSRRGRRPNNFKSLKELVRRLCEVLGVEVTEEDWGYLEELEEENVELICCEKCVEILRSVDKVQEVILKAQRELNVILEEVNSMIVVSESKSLKSSLWWKGCFDLRKNTLKKMESGRISSKRHSSGIQVKEECDDNHFDDLDNHDNWDSLQLDDSPNFQANLNEDCSVARGVATETGTTLPFKFEDVQPEAEPNPFGSTSKQLRSRKRKITVIAEDDELKEMPKRRRMSSSKRAAKRGAEEALKIQCGSNEASDDDANDNYDDHHQDDTYDATYQDNSNHLSEASDDDDKDDGVTISKSKKDDKTNSKSQTNKNTAKHADGEEDYDEAFGRSKKRPRKSNRPPRIFPFVVAEENLFLYRHDTFVRKTDQQLQCQAYRCTYSTEFDYYPSFQRMKAHLDTCHRNQTHRQRTPHPCIPCNILFKNREEFWLHCKSLHAPKFFDPPTAQAVCECCLAIKRQSQIKKHHFSHKNAQEKQAAIESNDAPYCFKQPKESEVQERPFVCDFDNCEKAFKSSKNLKRHKQTHLPDNLRTDKTICPECGKNVLTEDFRVHMEKFHHPETVEGVLICKYCDKRFHPKDKGVFRYHLKRHQGEKTHLCTECGLAFYEVGFLNAHIKHVHEEREPLPCQYCDKVYTISQSLRAHMLRHHPNKVTTKHRISKFYEKEEVKGDFIGPFQKFPCEICDMVCGYLQSLKRHMARTHGIGDASVKRPLGAYGPRKKKEEGTDQAPELELEEQGYQYGSEAPSNSSVWR